MHPPFLSSTCRGKVVNVSVPPWLKPTFILPPSRRTSEELQKREEKKHLAEFKLVLYSMHVAETWILCSKIQWSVLYSMVQISISEPIAYLNKSIQVAATSMLYSTSMNLSLSVRTVSWSPRFCALSTLCGSARITSIEWLSVQGE